MNDTRQTFWIHESPFEVRSAVSDRFFAIPRRCGHSSFREPETYHSYGLRRPFPDRRRILFQYTVAGEGELRCKGEKTRIHAGEALILVLPDAVEYLRPPQSELWEFLYVSFWHPFAVQMFLEVLNEENRVVRFDPDGNAIKSLWALFHLFQEIETFDRYAASEAGYRFLLHVCRELNMEKRKSTAGTLLPRVQAYCHCHLSQSVTSEELAKLCGYSRGHFTNLFRQETGMSPLDFILKTKLDAAIRIYQAEHVSIKELAERCGFQDQGYFTRRFRECYHMTPSEYFHLF